MLTISSSNVTKRLTIMSNTFRISLLTATVLFSASALSALPQGYPAEYQKVVLTEKRDCKFLFHDLLL